MKFRAYTSWIALALGLMVITFQVFTGNVLAKVIFSEFSGLRVAFPKSLSQESIGWIQDLPSPFQLVESETKSRSITLSNLCNEDLWAAAAGDIGTQKCNTNDDCGGADCVKGSCTRIACSENSHCPVNQYCAMNIPINSKNCTHNGDCNSTIKETCDSETHQCVSHQCYFAPVPVNPPIGVISCKSNLECNEEEFCYATNGVQHSRSGVCAPLPSIANGWDLKAKTSVSFPVPSPWAGRFWARTNCKESGTDFTCDTGQCLGLSGNTFSKYCGQSGLSPSTLAELNLSDFYGGSDYYDVSMVDGANVPVQIAPVSGTYNVGVDNQSAVGGICATDAECQTGGKYNWTCGTVGGQNRCVNKYECGSPGCFEKCEQYGCGQYISLEKVLPVCQWSDTNFAVDQEACPKGLRKLGDNGYAGCYSAEQACANMGAQNGLDCSDASQHLYGCTDMNAQSCYDPNAGGTNCPHDQNNCCGCPAWGEPECQCHNTNWDDTSLPYVQVFHNACPTAYAFPFDDTTNLFTCIGQSADNNVSYRIVFCPNSSAFDSELQRLYLPVVIRE